MPCMCGDTACHSCGAAQGTLERGCHNCGKGHKPNSKREAKCIEAMRKADDAYVKDLEETERLAKEYFSGAPNHD